MSETLTMVNVDDTAIVPAGIQSEKGTIEVLGYSLPIGVSIPKTVKDKLKELNPGLSGKKIKKMYEEYVRSNQVKIDAFEGHAMRSGYTKEIVRVDQKGNFQVKYTAPSEADSLQYRLTTASKKFTEANPTATAAQLQKFQLKFLRNELTEADWKIAA